MWCYDFYVFISLYISNLFKRKKKLCFHKMFLVQMAPFWRLAQNTYLYHYIFTHHLLYTLLEYRVFLPLPGAIHFPFSWLSVFWRQTMAHDCIGRSGLASARFKCATASKSTTVSSQFIDHVDFVVTWRVCCCYLFHFLSRSIQFEILMSVSWNFKGIDIWFSVLFTE